MRASELYFDHVSCFVRFGWARRNARIIFVNWNSLAIGAAGSVQKMKMFAGPIALAQLRWGNERDSRNRTPVEQEKNRVAIDESKTINENQALIMCGSRNHRRSQSPYLRRFFFAGNFLN